MSISIKPKEFRSLQSSQLCKEDCILKALLALREGVLLALVVGVIING